MSMAELLDRLHEREVSLSVRNGDLAVNGKRHVLTPELVARLREHKAALMALIESGRYDAARVGGEEAPGGIPAGCTAVTPEMLTLVTLDASQIERIVATVPGGAANVQDIYPLAPLQEGILFHHLMTRTGDPYLLRAVYACDTRERVDQLLAALQATLDRHDILRTAFVWEGLAQPLQVVWRNAPLPVDELELDPAQGDVVAQLQARFDPRQHRLDTLVAPLMRVACAFDADSGRWVLLHTFHHLLMDHTTMEVMQQEIQAHLEGRAATLPLAMPFRQFVAQVQRGVSREEHEAFFREMLGDVDEPTLPYSLSAGTGDTTEAGLPLSPVLARRLRECARTLGVSVASLCHVAWAQVLARVCGRDDVVFGTVLFGRMQGGQGADRSLGLFMNTLPFRVRLGEESAVAVVRQVHALLARLLHHEHAPLSLAQRCSRVAAASPLFSAFLNYRHNANGASAARRDAVATRGAAPAGDAWSGIEFQGAHEGSNYPLSLSVDDFGDHLALSAQAIAPVDPARVCGHAATALESLVTALERAPNTPLADLEVLPAAERTRLLQTFNDTHVDYPGNPCLHDLIADMARQAPESIALVFADVSLTRAQLDHRAHRLALVLREVGIGPDVRVAVCMERSVEMVVSLLAILKAGGAYVPLEPVLPAERLADMLADSGARLLLVHEATRAAWRDSLVSTLVVTADTAPAEPVEPLPLIAPSPSNLAYVIYTSGSTGRPKGVMNEHRAVVNRLRWMQQAHPLRADDAVLQKTPFGFDVSVWEFFWPLLAGARLVVAAPNAHKDPAQIVSLIREHGITTLHFVPSMLQMFLAHEDARTCTGVRRVFCSGEALSVSLARQCRETLPQAGLHNLYGPTEAAVDVTAWTCSADDDAHELAGVPIGRPIANTRIYLLDDHTRPVPLGAVGEIHIGGVQVARGYLQLPELNAQRFIADPYGQETGARLYRTGDLGRQLPGGEILFLGRNDRQVKLRGLRIELGEIEVQLARHPSVQEAVVTVREDTPGDRRIVGYTVARAGQAVPETETLRAHLLRTLPDYMVPSAFVSMPSWPLTSSGKLDRQALPTPEGVGLGADDYEAPCGELETALARIWCEVLKLNRVGRHDDFFVIGGHSLLAMVVASRMRQEGLNADVGRLFLSPTIAQLAQSIGATQAVDVPPNLIPSATAPAATSDPGEWRL